MPLSWDHKSELHLLLAIIDEGGPSKGAWSNITATMVARGYPVTIESCRQHFTKVKKEHNSGNSKASAPSSTPVKSKTKAPAKATPRKRTTPGKATDTSTTTSNFVENDNEDDEEPFTSPPKRVKKEEENGGQTATQFKMEDGNGVIDLEHDDLYDDEA